MWIWEDFYSMQIKNELKSFFGNESPGMVSWAEKFSPALLKTLSTCNWCRILAERATGGG